MKPDRAEHLLGLYKEARRLIREPSCWITNCAARDQNGFSVSAVASEAVKFSIVGALRRARVNLDMSVTVGNIALDLLLHKLEIQGGGSSDLAAFNDNADMTHGIVLALLDQMIQEVESVIL